MSSKGKKKVLKCLDLFCGAGGLSCGLHLAGIQTVAGIDFDAAAIETFNRNKLGKGLVADLEKITSDEVRALCGGSVDIIAGGPPCQGFSLSGFRDESDKRNRLYKSFVRIVRDLKPRAFLLENVPGLVSLFNGRAKDAIEAEFAALGFKVIHKILRASDYGVPQHRRRVVFIGLREGDFKYPNQEFFEHPAKNQKRMVSCKEALSDLPPLSGPTELGEEVQSYVCSPKCEYQRIMRQHSKAVHNHVAAMHSEKVRSIIAMVAPGKNYKSLPEEFRKSRNFHVAWTRFPENEPSPTIDTGHRHHFHYKECRVPTVRECARLQSFPDAFIFTGNKTKQFRQVGRGLVADVERIISDMRVLWGAAA